MNSVGVAHIVWVVASGGCTGPGAPPLVWKLCSMLTSMYFDVGGTYAWSVQDRKSFETALSVQISTSRKNEFRLVGTPFPWLPLPFPLLAPLGNHWVVCSTWGVLLPSPASTARSVMPPPPACRLT